MLLLTHERETKEANIKFKFKPVHSKSIKYYGVTVRVPESAKYIFTLESMTNYMVVVSDKKPIICDGVFMAENHKTTDWGIIGYFETVRKGFNSLKSLRELK